MKLLLGTIAVAAPSQALVFQLSPHNRLKFTIKGRDILLLDLTVSTLAGYEVLQVTENHITHHPRPNVEFQHVPGRIRVIVPHTDEFVPAWVVQHMRLQEPAFGDSGQITALGITVVRPG